MKYHIRCNMIRCLSRSILVHRCHPITVWSHGVSCRRRSECDFEAHQNSLGVFSSKIFIQCSISQPVYISHLDWSGVIWPHWAFFYFFIFLMLDILEFPTQYLFYDPWKPVDRLFLLHFGMCGLVCFHNIFLSYLFFSFLAFS